MVDPMEPCPFCGKRKVRIHPYHYAHGKSWEEGDVFGYVAICSFLEGGCGASTTKFSDSEQAVKKWNTRQ